MSNNLKAGTDYIGVGVGALIFNQNKELLLMKRGQAAKNEVNKWEIPGGEIQFKETLETALKREIREEVGLEIAVIELLQVIDHIIPQEKQHWIALTYICQIKHGQPTIMEPRKCEQLAWFSLKSAKNLNLSLATQKNLAYLDQHPDIISDLF